MDATGSVWNTNDWHWEEKSYTKFAKEFLEKRLIEGSLLEHDIPGSGLCGLAIAESVTVGGDASLSVRKGKSIVATDINVEILWGYFLVKKQSDLAASTERWCLCRGNCTAREISLDSIEDGDFDIVARIIGSVTAPKVESDYKLSDFEGTAQNAVKLLRRSCLEKLQKMCKELELAIRNAEGDKERLLAAQRQRAAEANLAKKASEEKGEEKLRIASDVKLQDEQRKQQMQLNTPQPMVEPTAEGKGSVWNVNSYHWEEKPMTSWCISTLKDRLETTEFLLLDKSTKLSFFNVKVEGDASISIRKGKKLCVFELSISASWSAVARDSNDIFLSESRGRMDIKDFCSDDIDDYRLIISGDGKIPPEQRIDAAAKAELPALLKTLLTTFVTDLNARG